jgi:Phage integrase, N-terminal SAM-like domain
VRRGSFFPDVVAENYKLGSEQIRQYQAYLFQTKKLTIATVSQYVSALRFLYVKTLRLFSTPLKIFEKNEEMAQAYDMAEILLHPVGKTPASPQVDSFHDFFPGAIYLPVPVRCDVCGLLLALSWTIN